MTGPEKRLLWRSIKGLTEMIPSGSIPRVVASIVRCLKKGLVLGIEAERAGYQEMVRRWGRPATDSSSFVADHFRPAV